MTTSQVAATRGFINLHVARRTPCRADVHVVVDFRTSVAAFNEKKKKKDRITRTAHTYDDNRVIVPWLDGGYCLQIMNRSHGEETHVVDWVKFYRVFVRTSAKYDRANKHGLRLTGIHNEHFSPHRQKITVASLARQNSSTICSTGKHCRSHDTVL